MLRFIHLLIYVHFSQVVEAVGWNMDSAGPSISGCRKLQLWICTLREASSRLLYVTNPVMILNSAICILIGLLVI